MNERGLGSAEQAERVLIELYVDLRRSLRSWSEVTFQTPQPRMGYIGQHLTSVVTGLAGGRSGARGHDLVGVDGVSAEIKTCYRVDQLGSCARCKQALASFELVCPVCGSELITRKDDSKWLISPKHDEDMAAAFEPSAYYLVLFDFEDLAAPTTINARIWKVDPTTPGFFLAITDYYENIRANSTSKAPFNLWPFALKFYLMRPELIYWAVITDDDRVATSYFSGPSGPGKLEPLPSLTCFSRAKVPLEVLVRLCVKRNVDAGGARTNADLLALLEAARAANGWSADELADEFAWTFYAPLVRGHDKWLPRDADRRRLAVELAAIDEVGLG